MSSEISFDDLAVIDALAAAGRDERLRTELLDALRRAEAAAADPAAFRETVRWPLIVALLRGIDGHRVVLADGLTFEVGPDSRIEKALLLSPVERPDHVWEPQTTKLLVQLAAGARNVAVGGAYIGDHVLPLARATEPSGTVHAFEPMGGAYARLVRNVEINGIANVVPNRMALWDADGMVLELVGDLALASSSEAGDRETNRGDDLAPSVTLSGYAAARELPSVDLIMLDTEGSEERALRGGRDLLEADAGRAPTVVFEIHGNFVDWSEGLENTSVVRLLASSGYDVYAIRDMHANYPMAGQPVEIIPVASVYVEGPPHGFNMLAVKDPTVVEALDLRVVEGVSPKLLPDRDPTLHHPLGGFDLTTPAGGGRPRG